MTICLKLSQAFHFLFSENPILFGEIADGTGERLTELYHSRWLKRIETDDDFGMITERTEGKKSVSDKIIRRNTIPPTMTSASYMVDYDTGCTYQMMSKLIGHFH